MQFRQLEYFAAVARERHFARAAEACYVSQPALSASIAKLERQLGVTLINRDHNFEGLTAEGERLAVWARRILAEKDGFKTELAAVQSGISGTLRLGVEPTASTSVAQPVAAFCAAHPLARVRVESRLSASELRRRLREFKLDAAIAHFDDDDDAGLHIVPLYEERYVVVASDERLIPRNAAMTWADAAQMPLALLKSDMRIRQIIDKAFAQAGVQPKPQIETDSCASLYALCWGRRMGHDCAADLVTCDAGGRHYEHRPVGRTGHPGTDGHRHQRDNPRIHRGPGLHRCSKDLGCQ